MEDICFCDTLVQLDKCYWMTPDLSDFYFVRKQLYSAKTSRFQLQLIASVRKYNYSADSTSFVQNFEFCLYNRRETRKSTFFDIKIDFSNKDTCFWDVLVELKDCYLTTPVLSEYDEYSKSYSRLYINFVSRAITISWKNRIQRKLLDFNYNW